MSVALVTGVILCLLLTSSAASGEPLLIEPDESIPGSFLTLSGIQHILPRSPHRVGDVGSGGDDWAPITSQYNQPRSGTTGTVMHRGVDLSSRVNGVLTNRTLFATMQDARVWLVNTALTGDAGRFVAIQNRHTEGSLVYHFQTVYMHLSRVDVTQGLSVTETSPVIGRTGGSGKTENSFIVHLHMEKRTPTEHIGTMGGRRYPPSFFYWRAPGTWGSDTSFINRTAISGNTVNFRIIDRGIDVAQANVGLFFRPPGGAWQGHFGNMSKSGSNFAFTFAGHPAGTIIEYYVQARSSSWDGILRTASRPYRYSDGRAPTSRPFRHNMVSILAATAATASLAGETAATTSPRQWWVEYDPEVNREEIAQTAPRPFPDKDEYLGAVVIERVVDESTFVAREIVGRTSAHKPILGRKIILRVSDIRGMGDMVVGEEYRVLGQVSSRDPLTVTFPDGEEIRPLFSDY